MTRRMFRTLVAALPLALLAPAQAALDGSAATDDHSINVPTAWWTFQNLTPLQLQAKLTELGARVTEVEVTGVSGGVPRMTVRLVANSGAYAVPGAAFLWGQSSSQLSAALSAANARLIELERYDAGGGNIRYVAVTVPNTGATARGWGWLLGRTKSEIQSWAAANDQRLIDLDGYGTGSARRWNAVLVANTGADSRRWEWDVDLSVEQVAARIGSFQGRLVKLDRQADGRYGFVQVDNTGSNASAWWHGYGFTSLGAVNDFAAQVGGRPVDIVRYTAGTSPRYDVVVIDNANAATRAVRAAFFARFTDASGAPVGITEAFLQRLDTGEVLVNLNASRPAETASALKALHLLHAMKQVNAGDPLASDFTYYNYPTDYPDPADACPQPSYESFGNDKHTTLETALDEMMGNSDNRMTRGVVLRYGGFAPLNATAQAAQLKSTVLRHNIGCAYVDVAAGTYSPSTLRNDTSAADLAAIWAGVHRGTLLPKSGPGRAEFLESGNPALGAGEDLRAVIDQEAAALGLSATDAATFASRVRTWGKGGSYDTYLPDPFDPAQAGQAVEVRSTAGLLALPSSRDPRAALRYHAYATLMSDVPVNYHGSDAAAAYISAYRSAHYESLRRAVRLALEQW